MVSITGSYGGYTSALARSTRVSEAARTRASDQLDTLSRGGAVTARSDGAKYIQSRQIQSDLATSNAVRGSVTRIKAMHDIAITQNDSMIEVYRNMRDYARQATSQTLSADEITALNTLYDDERKRGIAIVRATSDTFNGDLIFDTTSNTYGSPGNIAVSSTFAPINMRMDPFAGSAQDSVAPDVIIQSAPTTGSYRHDFYLSAFATANFATMNAAAFATLDANLVGHLAAANGHMYGSSSTTAGFGTSNQSGLTQNMLIMETWETAMDKRDAVYETALAKLNALDAERTSMDLEQAQQAEQRANSARQIMLQSMQTMTQVLGQTANSYASNARSYTPNRSV
jgi:hypothetical protein